MRPEEHVVAARSDEERVLRVTRRMVRREVERGEVVLVVLDLGALGHPEAHRDEDVDDLLLDPAEGVDVTVRALAPGQRDVDAVLGERAAELLGGEHRALLGERLDDRVLHLVGERSHHGALRVRSGDRLHVGAIDGHRRNPPTGGA